jgi:hypothetical protein
VGTPVPHMAVMVPEKEFSFRAQAFIEHLAALVERALSAR